MVKTEAWPTTAGETIEIPSINRISYKLGLYVIATVGLGVKLAWAMPPTPPGHRKGLHENIQVLEHLHMLLIIFSQKILNTLPINACVLWSGVATTDSHQVQADYGSIQRRKVLYTIGNQRKAYARASVHGSRRP